MAAPLLDTGLRLGKACHREWHDRHLNSGIGAKYGFIFVRGGKTSHARCNVLLTQRALEMLKLRQAESKSLWVFPSEDGQSPLSRSTVSHKHTAVRRQLKMPEDFVVHSLRHTMLTRLGAAGADAFSFKKLAEQLSVTVSERYVHPTPESIELHFRCFEHSAVKQLTEGEAKVKVTTILLRYRKRQKRFSRQPI